MVLKLSPCNWAVIFAYSWGELRASRVGDCKCCKVTRPAMSSCYRKLQETQFWA